MTTISGKVEFINSKVTVFYSDLKTELGVKVPSLLFFKTQNQKPEEILRISDIKRGNLYEKAKSLRKLPVIR